MLHPAQPLPRTPARWLALAAPWLLVAVYAAGQLVVLAGLSGTEISFSQAFISNGPFLIGWALATPLIFRSARRFPLTGGRWLLHLGLHLFTATIFIVGLNLLAQLPGVRFGEAGWGDALVRASARAVIAWYHLSLIVYFFLLALEHWRMSVAARRVEELRAAELNTKLAEAQLDALRNQLQPHFLFNALNSLGALMRVGRTAEAIEMVGGLGELLRELLRPDGRNEVTLAEEIALTQTYVEIEQLRFADRLRVEWNIPETTLAALVPRLVLQPLVENAIRHGVARAPDAGRVVIAARPAEDRLELRVWNDGAPPGRTGSIEPGFPTGIGLSNTKARLTRLYGPDHALALRLSGGGTEVHVSLPLRRGSTSSATEVPR